MNNEAWISRNDERVLRGLAEWQAEASRSGANRERIAAWYAHDAWMPTRRPMVLVERRRWDEGEGPIGERDLCCTTPWAREREFWIRNLRHHVEVYRDDHVVPPFIAVTAPFQRTGFGVASAQHREAGADRLAFNYSDAPLKRLDDGALR